MINVDIIKNTRAYSNCSINKIFGSNNQQKSY